MCGFALGFASLRDAEMEPGAIALGKVARAPAQPCRVRARSTARGDDDDATRRRRERRTDNSTSNASRAVDSAR